MGDRTGNGQSSRGEVVRGGGTRSDRLVQIVADFMVRLSFRRPYGATDLANIFGQGVTSLVLG